MSLKDQFVQTFRDKVIIYDPLDRHFEGVNEDGETINQATPT